MAFTFFFKNECYTVLSLKSFCFAIEIGKIGNHCINYTKKQVLDSKPSLYDSTCVLYLQYGDQQHKGSDGVHHASIVGGEGLAASALPHVEILCVVVIAVVGRVVGHLALDAGPGGTGVAAAEGDSVHQVLAVHVAPDAANGKNQGGRHSLRFI